MDNLKIFKNAFKIDQSNLNYHSKDEGYNKKIESKCYNMIR